MNFYKIIVAYDGTRYHGWQFQDNAITIAGTLELAFMSVFHQRAAILGASRTDAGVHALGQVAILQTVIDINPEQMLRAWSKAVPSDIVILNIRKISSLVHPHDGVIQKIYSYTFFLQRPLPFVQKYGWYIYRSMNLDVLQKALNLFVGTHDFRSFCTGNDLVDTVKTIDSVEIVYVKEWNSYKIIVKGKSFLRYMVRRIVGACLTVASSSDITLEDLKRVLEMKNPGHTLPNAPAKGLLLERIVYDQGEVL